MHLLAGLPAALVLIVIGLTGAALAFRDDYVRWANASFFSGESLGPAMGHDALVAKVEAEYAPSRVESINLIWPGDFQYYFMNDRGPLIVNSVDGRVLDPRAGEAWHSKLVIKANELHTKLALGEPGRIARDIATYEVLLLIPTGVILWWRTKRFSLKWRAPWYRRLWDFHNTVGISVALPVMFLAFTGSLIALRLPESFQSDSPEPPRQPDPRSVFIAEVARRVPTPIDTAIALAEAALPDVPTYQVALPDSPVAPIAVNKVVGGFAARNHRSTVYVDRYSGQVLRVDRARPYTSAYRAYSFGKRIHTGGEFGGAGKAILMVSSFCFAGLAVSGLGLGIRKVYGWRTRSQSGARATTPE